MPSPERIAAQQDALQVVIRTLGRSATRALRLSAWAVCTAWWREPRPRIPLAEVRLLLDQLEAPHYSGQRTSALVRALGVEVERRAGRAVVIGLDAAIVHLLLGYYHLDLAEVVMLCNARRLSLRRPQPASPQPAPPAPPAPPVRRRRALLADGTIAAPDAP